MPDRRETGILYLDAVTDGNTAADERERFEFLFMIPRLSLPVRKNPWVRRRGHFAGKRNRLEFYQLPLKRNTLIAGGT